MKKLFLTLGVGAAIVLVGGAAIAQKHGSYHHGPKHMFKKMDTNKDGTITREEMQAGRAAVFEKKDANKDGILTKDELKAHMEKRFEERMKHMRKRFEKRAGHKLRRMDLDHDGSVTKDEFFKATDHRFYVMDSNGDGKIEKQELRSGRRGHHGSRDRHKWYKGGEHRGSHDGSADGGSSQEKE